MVDLYGYSSVNHLQIARNHFEKVLNQMIEHYRNHKIDFKFTYNDWVLVVESEHIKATVDLMTACEWSFCEIVDDAYTGIKFRKDDDSYMILVFNSWLFDGELIFIGLHELK